MADTRDRVDTKNNTGKFTKSTLNPNTNVQCSDISGGSSAKSDQGRTPVTEDELETRLGRLEQENKSLK